MRHFRQMIGNNLQFEVRSLERLPLEGKLSRNVTDEVQPSQMALFRIKSYFVFKKTDALHPPPQVGSLSMRYFRLMIGNIYNFYNLRVVVGDDPKTIKLIFERKSSEIIHYSFFNIHYSLNIKKGRRPLLLQKMRSPPNAQNKNKKILLFKIL